MIVSVKQYVGTILNTQLRASPTAEVESMILRIKTIIAPIPPKRKCMNIVRVLATFSFVKKKEVK